MGNECCDMIRQAVTSVIDNDKAIAQQVIKRDKMVNAVNAEIAISPRMSLPCARLWQMICALS